LRARKGAINIYRTNVGNENIIIVRVITEQEYKINTKKTKYQKKYVAPE